MATSEELFLKEKQDYLDAVEAYRRILARDAQTLSDPFGLNSWYAPEAQGYERAATDPWIVERFPDLARAGQKVVAEEAEYLALDEPRASHAQDNCSITSYTTGKFYEYVAMMETVYLLASDQGFRDKVLAELERGFWGNLFTMIGAGYGADARAIAGLVNDDIARQNMEMAAEGRRAAAALNAQIAATFQAAWDTIKQNYNECGLGNTIVKVAVDGVFLVGEIAIGAAALKALKLAATIVQLPSGASAVRVSVQGFASSRLAANAEIADLVNSVDGKTFGFDALEAKYGRPDENHIGGALPDTNRPLPDRSAEEMLAEKRAAEQRAGRTDERPDGSYRNPNDPEGVRRAADGEAMVEENGQWKRISETSNNTKGRFGETMADDWAAKQTPPWQKVNGPNATLDTPGHNGLDAVYRNPNPPPDYFVTDAKYGSAGLGRLVDGTQQMSPDWIEPRLKTELGRAQAERVMQSYEPGVLRIDKNGNVTWQSLKNYVWRRVQPTNAGE